MANLLPTTPAIRSVRLIIGISLFSLLTVHTAFAADSQHIATIETSGRDSSRADEQQSPQERLDISAAMESYEAYGHDYQSRIMDLISYSLGFYMQELIIWKNPQVTFRHPVPEQFGHLNEIVTQALELYDHPAKDSFWGFSGRVEKKLIILQQTEGYTIDYKNTHAPIADGKIGFNTLQKTVLEIKHNATDEVEDFIDEHPEPINTEGQLLMSDDSLTREDKILLSLERASKTDVAMLIDSLFELEEVPHGFIDKINVRIQELENPSPVPEFRKNQPLDPIAHLIETESLKDESELDVEIPKAGASRKKSRDKSSDEPIDFNARVLELLEENNRLMSKYNDRFDYMQAQIDDLKEAQQNVPDETEQRLQQQIDDLYSKIGQIGKDPSSPVAGAEEKLKPLQIVFERNSHDISLFHQSVLNEVVAGLMKNKSYKVMITGFADAIGDKKYNILLSQKRAQAVRNYLVESGVNASRLVVNYYGDNKSDSLNPLDRKVEVEWLVDYSSSGD